jgi:trigger factor
MQNVETLSALERRIEIAVPAAEINKEVTARLTRLARTVRMPGFRPGKVPMKMVASSYGAQVQAEVLNDKVGEAFSTALKGSNLRVAGTPQLTPKESAGEQLAFSATFEVYPEIRIGELSSAEVKRAVCPVGDDEVDKTIDIMRRQRAKFEAVERAAADGDRLTIDFVGRIDGTPFEGGSGNDFTFTLGQGRMLPDFESALRGAASGSTKTFQVQFPADYRATDLAGKNAQFEVTVKAVEQPLLPPVDAEFARSLGIADGDLAKMRAEVKANLEREVSTRLRARTKDSVMAALLGAAQFDVPKSLVQEEQQRLAEMARADLVARGIDAKEAPLPAEVFAPQAERRVRLGLLIAELVRAENLQARQDQVRKAIEEVAQSYEKPAQVIQWYLGNRERLAEVETMTLENNVVEWVLKQARVADVTVPFDELMGHGV